MCMDIGWCMLWYKIASSSCLIQRHPHINDGGLKTLKLEFNLREQHMLVEVHVGLGQVVVVLVDFRSVLLF